MGMSGRIDGIERFERVRANHFGTAAYELISEDPDRHLVLRQSLHVRQRMARGHGWDTKLMQPLAQRARRICVGPSRVNVMGVKSFEYLDLVKRRASEIESVADHGYSATRWCLSKAPPRLDLILLRR